VIRCGLDGEQRTMTRISGSVALVTGGAGGIGRAIARRLSADGASVVTTDRAGTAADMLADVTDAGAMSRLVEQVIAEHGRIDIVVTAAGVGVGGVIEELDEDAWRRAIDVNLWGTINTIRAAYPELVRQRSGHIVVVASLAGLVPTPLLVPYSTSKAAVVGLAASLRPEAARHGIGVSAVCPGPVDTPMLDTGGAGGAGHGIDARRYLTSAAGKAIDPAVVGAATARGITRNRAVVAPKRAGTLWRATRFAPALAERAIASAMGTELQRAQLG
jgi:NAD(P)-dependent dehydrogenase (short-subunit alcohol dehydrogenase family)